MNIAARLDEAMSDAGFGSNQSALHRASQVPQPTINRILQGGGKRGPETETVKKLAAACNVNFLWLMEGKGPKNVDAPHQQAQAAPVDAGKVDFDEILQLISLYRESTETGRRQILRMAENAEKVQKPVTLSAVPSSKDHPQ